MKRITAYSLLLTVLFILAACGEREIIPENATDHFIELTFGNITPPAETKADHSRGVDAYNENKIASVDCFFYPEGATDSPAVFSALGRGAEAVTEGDSTVYKVKIFFTDDEAAAMFGSTTSGTCKAYVICNAPLSYSSDTSVPALKELVLESDFSAQTVQGSFVMSAEEPATVTLTTTGGSTTAAGRVHVRRSAAKIQLYLRLPSEFVADDGETWEPYLSQPVQVMLANGVKRGKVDGNYSVQSADYFNTYYRNMTELSSGDSMLVEGKTEYNYTSVPFYSYPATWTDLSTNAPALVFKIPWHIKGSTGGYRYKLYQVSPNMSGLKFERNHFYRIFVNVSSLGGADEDQTVVITDCSYLILPWFFSSSAGQGLVPGDFTTYKYLVIDQPEITLNNESTAYFSYVSSSSLSSVTVTRIKYLDNTKEANPVVDLSTGETGFSDAAAAVTVNTATPGVVSVTHNLVGVYSKWEIWARVTNNDGIPQVIHVIQNPAIGMEISQAKAGDVFVDGWFGRVMTVPGTNTSFYVQNITSNYANGSFRSKYSSTTGTSTDYDLSYVTSPYGIVRTMYSSGSGGSQTYNGIYYTTYVSISGFNNTNNTFVSSQGTVEYVIADPRCKASEYDASFSLANYLYDSGSGDGSFAAWSSPGDIMIGVTDPAESNRIAPRFLVSSSLNSVAGGTQPTYDIAIKRAATYQEAGYPAGRWRLPTEAEVRFMQQMQTAGKIPALFGTTQSYWCSDGYLIAGDSTPTLPTSTDTQAAVRFVYDLWYWGDEAAATNVYHPNGHNTAY